MLFVSHSSVKDLEFRQDYFWSTFEKSDKAIGSDGLVFSLSNVFSLFPAKAQMTLALESDHRLHVF